MTPEEWERKSLIEKILRLMDKYEIGIEELAQADAEYWRKKNE